MKKIKLREIVLAFREKEDAKKALIIHVFDNIAEFDRKVQLMSSYKELTEIYDMYISQRKQIVDDLINAYAKKENIKTKDLEGQPIPPQVQVDFEKKNTALLDTEIEYTSFFFKRSEVDKAGLTISEMISIRKFINIE
jgi:predicted DNA-binding protein YlxM (UPF0122 family)